MRACVRAVVGCGELVAPAGAHVLRDDTAGALTVVCDASRQTFRLVCVGRRWSGRLHNCTQPGASTPASETHLSPSRSSPLNLLQWIYAWIHFWLTRRMTANVLPINFVLDLRKLCFLSKQRCHSISVHNVFYDIFGFYEFNRLCSVYSVCVQSRGYFIASVWDVFRALVFWLLYWLYSFFWSVCLSVSTHCCVNKDYQYQPSLIFSGTYYRRQSVYDAAILATSIYPQWNTSVCRVVENDHVSWIE